MGPSLTVEFYDKIMNAETEGVVVDLNIQIQIAVLDQEIVDEKDIMILNMALQIKSNFFLMREMMLTSSHTIIMTSLEDFDPEDIHIEEFQQEEFDEFKDGNVVMMTDFKKK